MDSKHDTTDGNEFPSETARETPPHNGGNGTAGGANQPAEAESSVRHGPAHVRQISPPGPAPSGTSGSVFSDNLGKIQDQIGVESYPQNNLPDLPNGAFCLPDGCRTVLDTCRTAPSNCRTEGGAPPPPVPGPAPAPESPIPHLPVRGILRVGPMHAPRSEWAVLEHPDLVRVLQERPPAPDWIITADDHAEVTFLDLDTHRWKEPPEQPALAAHVATLQPPPDVWWATHGRGLRAVYTGPYHRARAVAGALAAPKAFDVEIKRDTRHPLSLRSDRPSALCGPLGYNLTHPEAPFVFRSIGKPTPEQRKQALEKLGMEVGGRYHHDHCPIDPTADSDAQGCVVVGENGVYCHRCAGRGKTFQAGAKPGWFPFTAVTGCADTLLDTLTRERVHWTHARLVLRHHHANLGEGVLREAYRLCLTACYKETDPRVGLVFNRDLDFVRGAGLWLDSQNFKPTDVDNDAANALPYVMYVVKGKDCEATVLADGARRSQVKNRDPRAYMPIRPYRGITFSDDIGTIPVQVAPHPRFPIHLLDDPLPLEEAFQFLARAFPRLNRHYLMGCIAAGICAEAGSGQPPMLCATGPSGSGKGETPRLAASFLGEDAIKVQLCENAEEFMRNIGMILAAGNRFIVFDELGKTAALHKRLGPLLQLGAAVDWRPLYQSVRVHTPCCAAFFYPCVRFPESLTNSPELLRRTRAVHLHRKTPNWEETSGGDTTKWRDRTEENAHVANSLLTHTWRMCHAYGFRFL